MQGSGAGAQNVSVVILIDAAHRIPWLTFSDAILNVFSFRLKRSLESNLACPESHLELSAVQ